MMDEGQKTGSGGSDYHENNGKSSRPESEADEYACLVKANNPPLDIIGDLEEDPTDVITYTIEHVETVEAVISNTGRELVNLDVVKDHKETAVEETVGLDGTNNDVVHKQDVSTNVGVDHLLLRKDFNLCRICHEIGNREQFIAPCNCKGSLNLVHKHCLETWLAESDSTVCELCGFEFNTKRMPKHFIIASVFAWLVSPTNNTVRKMLKRDILTFFFLFPLMLACSLLGFRIANTLFAPDIEVQITEAVLTRILQMIVVSSVVLLDMGVISWTSLKIHKHFHSWYSWYRRNCKVILIDYPDVNNQACLAQSSSSSVRIMTF